ncbi:membrane protein [Marinicauda pacifica]|jgi:predicted tellurium resistance membrane protein TerC|uniref:TerC family protein n=1 Tax=Marinicauda pacifica TaxID=1133559 RepID=A0A4S2H8Y1_9PROT|nr:MULTISPECIES: TerC family protein [Marinicauda]TGY92305.1 TerC family protein [Marinicauda pacifica]GGE47777.1 membrane protein [Marinicauda pacifica]
MFELLSDPAIWASFVTLAFLEIVLGIDNIIFVAVMADRLPESQRAMARRLGLLLALGLRVVMLIGLVWIAQLEQLAFTLFELEFSWRDLVLLAGGGFLLAKATIEIHHAVEGDDAQDTGTVEAGFTMTVMQIGLIDIVFSLDSVITAVGMTDVIAVMIAAVVLAIGVMILAAETVAGFINRHPTTKMLALSFLILVGVALIADGLGSHIPRGYLYFAIAFSLLVETLNIFAKKARKKA